MDATAGLTTLLAEGGSLTGRYGKFQPRKLPAVPGLEGELPLQMV